MSRISHHKKRKVELLRLISLCEKYKLEIVKDFNKLNDYHGRGFISVKEYYDELKARFDDRHPEDWIDYYDRCIAYHKHELSACEKRIGQVRTRRVVIPLIVMLALLIITGIGLLWSNAGIFGFTVYEPGQTVNETFEINLTDKTFDSEQSTVTAVLNDQSSTVPLNQFSLQDNVAIIDTTRFNVQAENGTLIIRVAYNDTILSELYHDIPGQETNATEDITVPEENTTLPEESITLPETITPELEKKELETRIRNKPHSEGIRIKDLISVDGKFDFEIEFTQQDQPRGMAKLEGLTNTSDMESVQFGTPSEKKIRKGVITTDIVAINPIGLTNATIKLRKNGNGNTIMKCSDWDYDNFNCREWTETSIQFEDDGENITFTVESLTAYAGAEITILNVQSYPFVGGNWTVKFTTTGTADLIVKAVNGTTWSNTNDNEDLKFLEIRCGERKIEPEWEDNQLVVREYNCNETGYETSNVLTPDKHTLEFNFGEEVDYAYNQATYVLFLNSTTSANPCPTNHKMLNTGAVTGVVTVREPGETDATTVAPGNSDAGVWNSTGANRGNTTPALEIANPGQSSRTTASIGEGWLWNENLTGLTIESGATLDFNLDLLGCQAAAGSSQRYVARASVVSCSGGAMTWKRDLFGTRITGEGSHSGGQEGWYDSDSRIAHPALNTISNAAFSIATNDSYTFQEGDMLLIEMGFSDADSSTDRTACLRYNIANTNITVTLVTLDTLPPTVNLESPLNNSYNGTTNTIDFTYNVSDTSDVDNCSLLINNEVNITTDVGNITKDTTQNLTTYLPNGDYDWSVSCTDNSNNMGTGESRNISINYLPANNPPSILDIFIPSSIDPVDNSNVNVEFSFLADDQDGISQLLNASANASLTLDASGVGSGMQFNDTVCDASDTGNNASVQNYSCSITMRYWDRASDWSVNVTISDSASQATTYNETFTYNSLTAINMTPSSMGWAQVTLLSADQLSISNPIIISNTGNYNVSIGNINISAVDLGGETSTNQFITANNFTINTLNACNSGNWLQNKSAGDTAVIGAGLPTGLDVGEKASDKLLYLCLEELPQTISQQSYSTVNVEMWTIGVT